MTNTDYQVASVKDPGVVTSSSSPQWTQSQGGVAAKAYSAMMLLQDMLEKLQDDWQAMINVQTQAASASAVASADATKAAAKDSANMLICQAWAAGAQAVMAGVEGGVAYSQYRSLKPQLTEIQNKQNQLNTLDQHLNNPPGQNTVAGTQMVTADNANLIRKDQLLRGGGNLYDRATAENIATNEEIIGAMTPEERLETGKQVTKERENLSRAQNNVTSEMQRNSQYMQLTSSFINNGVGAIDKGVESKYQTQQGIDQAYSSILQNVMQQQQQATSEAGKNKDGLAASASKALDILAALAQASRA